jgi:hypothetical protein
VPNSSCRQSLNKRGVKAIEARYGEVPLGAVFCENLARGSRDRSQVGHPPMLKLAEFKAYREVFVSSSPSVSSSSVRSTILSTTRSSIGCSLLLVQLRLLFNFRRAPL